MNLENLAFSVQQERDRRAFLLEENQKLLAELDVLKEIVQKKRYEKLSMTDRDKFVYENMKGGF